MRAVALLCALSVASCSTVQPQIFSEELSPTRPAVMPSYGDGPQPVQPAAVAASGSPSQFEANLPVETAIKQAEALQRLYVKAVQDHSGLNAGSSAALITLSALALITGVTHPKSKDLAVMGVAGSGLYAYSSTMTSKPRQLVYLAGVETLNCAVAATRPYVLPVGFLTAAPNSDPLSDKSLDGLSTKADDQARGLSSLIELLTAMNASRVVTEPERKSTCPSQAAPLPVKPSGTDPDRLRAYSDRVAERNRADAACAGRAATVQELKPSPEIAHMIGQLQGQRKHLHRLVAQAQKQAVVFGNAGDALHKVSVDTQLSVAREVLKTEPDVASVLSAAQAMRGTAFALSGAPAFKPEAPASAASAAGAAQSSGTSRKSITTLPAKVDDPPAELLKTARAAIQGAMEIGDQLKGKLEILNQRLRLTRVPLERCGQGSAGAVLSLSPDISELELAPGASQNFSLSGGAGTPQAKAAAGLTRNLDGSFTFKLPASAEEGSTVTLVFTDGSGKLTREVTIKVVAAGEGAPTGVTMDAGKVPTAVMALALGLTTQPPSAQEVSAALTTCLKGSKFKIESPDLEHVPADAFAKVLNGDCRATS
ncbi:MAG: hypothetical protein HY020_12010 [Burkholderiales bacterium]|nr:hypothetical protein [Burkholderiales bacterium]